MLELHKPYWKEATELSEAKGKGARKEDTSQVKPARELENGHLSLRDELLPCRPSPTPAKMGTPGDPKTSLR